MGVACCNIINDLILLNRMYKMPTKLKSSLTLSKLLTVSTFITKSIFRKADLNMSIFLYIYSVCFKNCQQKVNQLLSFNSLLRAVHRLILIFVRKMYWTSNNTALEHRISRCRNIIELYKHTPRFVNN